MLILAVMLNCLAAGMLFWGAAQYTLGSVPADYHAEILEKEGVDLSPHMIGILASLYRSLAATMAALGVMILVLSLGPVAQDAVWAQGTVAMAGSLFAAAATLGPLAIEGETGVRTPWRAGLAFGGVIFAGFFLALIG